MNPTEFAKLFPLGTHLCREPMPAMSELKNDMENLKRHGFNLIKLQEHWAIDEPLEGHFDFSRYEELIEYAARLDMGVYLGLTCEQAPGWLWRKHPGCRMVGRNGLPVAYEAQATLPADGKPGPCYDHAGARADMEHFIRELVRALGKHENIVVWNTWQEIAYWSENLVGQQVCYCRNTLNAFRAWLREKYDDLDGLNRAWNTRYLDWPSILPDRCAVVRHPQPHNVDWDYFMHNVQIGNILRSRAKAIREADPLGRPVFAHKGGPVIGSGMDWTYARCQDFMGSSCYPAWHSFHPWDDGNPGAGKPITDRHDALLAEIWDGVALKYDYIRSCNPRGKPVWAAEFQGGPVSTSFHKGRVPSPDDMRRWLLTAVGSGVTAISFWVTRAEIAPAEMNGFSLLDSEGDSTPRFEEATRIGAALSAHPDLFAQPTRPWSEVAILINELNYQFCNSLGYGHEHLPYSVRGWYRLLWDIGIPVDFLEVSELDEAYAAHYKAIIMPFPIALSEVVAGKLARYVENGGNLISEAAPGRLNEHGYTNRGELSPTLRQLFGVRQTSFTMVREPGEAARWMPQERTWGECLEATMLQGAGPLAGHAVRASVYVEAFACEGSEPVLRCGNAVAGTVRATGKGRAWLLGTYVGHNGTAYRSDLSHGCVQALLAHAGIMPEREGALLLRKRVAAGKEAWIFTNPTDDEVTMTIPVQGWSRVTDPLGQPVEIVTDGQVNVSVKPLDVRMLVLVK